MSVIKSGITLQTKHIYLKEDYQNQLFFVSWPFYGSIYAVKGRFVSYSFITNSQSLFTSRGCLAALQDTTMFIILTTKGPEYRHGTFWSRSRMVNHVRVINCYKNVFSPDYSKRKTDIVEELGFLHVPVFPLPDLFVTTKETALIFAAPWFSHYNVASVNTTISFQCPKETYADYVSGFEGTVRCFDASEENIYCKEIQGCTKSCTKCVESTVGLPIEMVHAPSHRFPFKMTCKPKSKVCSTPEVYDKDRGSCRACNPLANCVKCFPFYQTCEVCQEGFKYNNLTEHCQKCNHPGCRRCQDVHNPGDKTLPCEECERGYVLKVYSLMNKVCWKCPENCEVCSEDAKTCRLCSKGYIKNSRQGEFGCIKACEKGFYSNEDLKCVPCNSTLGPCLECTDEGGACLNCERGSSLNNDKCVKNCPENSYFGPEGTCLRCDGEKNGKFCKECHFGTGECTECTKNSRLDAGEQKCVLECQDDHYWLGPMLDECRACNRRVQGCTKCLDITGECMECSREYRLHKNSTRDVCYVACIPGSFWKGDKVDSCGSCAEGPKNNSKCFECEDITGECKSCQPGYFLSSNSFCQKECRPGEFWNGPELNECIMCGDKVKRCLKCSNMTGKCTECQPGYWLKGETCLVECNAGKPQYLLESFNVCKDCSDHCLRCKNNTGECVECGEDLEYYRDDNVCWFSKNFLELESRKLKVRLTEAYFDQLIAAVVLVFDKDIDSDASNLPRIYQNLVIKLIEKSRSGILRVEKEELKGNKKVIRLKVPSTELNNATINISTSLVINKASNEKLIETEKNEGNQGRRSGKDNHPHRRLLSSASLFTRTINRVYFYQYSNKELTSFIMSVMSYPAFLITIAYLVLDAQGALSLITFLQTLSYLRLIDASFPANYLIMAQALGKNLFLVLPNPIHLKHADFSCQLDSTYLKAGFGCSALSGHLGVLCLQMGALGALVATNKTILLGVMRSSKKAQNIGDLLKNDDLEGFKASHKIYYYMAVVDSRFSLDLLLVLVIAAQLDMLFPTLISLKYGSWRHPQTMVDGIVSITSLAGYTVLAFSLFYQIYRKKKQTEKKHSKGPRSPEKRSRRGSPSRQAQKKAPVSESPKKTRDEAQEQQFFPRYLAELLTGFATAVCLMFLKFSPALQVFVLVLIRAARLAYSILPVLRKDSSISKQLMEIIKHSVLLLITSLCFTITSHSFQQMILHDGIGNTLLVLAGLLLSCYFIKIAYSLSAIFCCDLGQKSGEDMLLVLKRLKYGTKGLIRMELYKKPVQDVLSDDVKMEGSKDEIYTRNNSVTKKMLSYSSLYSSAGGLRIGNSERFLKLKSGILKGETAQKEKRLAKDTGKGL